MNTWFLDNPGTTWQLRRGERSPLRDLPPGRIRVRVQAAALNARDLLIARGAYAFPALPGVVPLSDGAGTVVEVGEEVSSFKPGDAVTSTYFPEWTNGRLTLAKAAVQLGCSVDGMLTEERIFSENELMPMPTHLGFQEAATLPCAALTAWSALTGLARSPSPEDSVLILGSGGVALFALQFAHALKLRVIVAARGAERIGRLKSLGASAVIDLSSDLDLAASVRALTDGRGADHVVEAVGAAMTEPALRSVAIDGQVALVGAIGEGGTLEVAALNGAFALTKRIAVGNREAHAAMIKFISQHELRPLIRETVGFADARNAYEAQAASGVLGKVVITL